MEVQEGGVRDDEAMAVEGGETVGVNENDELDGDDDCAVYENDDGVTTKLQAGVRKVMTRSDLTKLAEQRRERKRQARKKMAGNDRHYDKEEL